MKEGISSIEKPTLTLQSLQFLQENDNATLSDLISHGWNRKTAEASLHKLKDLHLVEVQSSMSFPRFEKLYVLTRKGEYVGNFVKHLEDVLNFRLDGNVKVLSKFPRGSLPILVHLLNNEWNGISKMMDALGISPHQTYRCLDHMEEKGVVCREKCRMGKRTISKFHLSENGVHIAVALEALDRALRVP